MGVISSYHINIIRRIRPIIFYHPHYSIFCQFNVKLNKQLYRIILLSVTNVTIFSSWTGCHIVGIVNNLSQYKILQGGPCMWLCLHLSLWYSKCHLPSKVTFHQSLSVFFHQRLPSTKRHLPLKVVFCRS